MIDPLGYVSLISISIAGLIVTSPIVYFVAYPLSVILFQDGHRGVFVWVIYFTFIGFFYSLIWYALDRDYRWLILFTSTASVTGVLSWLGCCKFKASLKFSGALLLIFSVIIGGVYLQG